MTQPESDIEAAQGACIYALQTEESTHLFRCTLDEFAALPAVRDLYGKVSLVLTVPP
jgi:hypothetical protein